MIPPFTKENIQILAFDVDGTLFSSEEIISSTYQLAIEKFNSQSGLQLKIPNHDTIMLEIGKPVKTIFQNLLPDLAEPNRDIIANSVLGLLCEQILAGKGHYYDHAYETISRLYGKGYTLVLASNGRLPYLETIMAKEDLNQYIGKIITINNESIKTKGDILREYINIYNIEPENILMIGDRFADYEAAHTTGSPFVFCEYGHAVKDEIPDFSIKITNLSDLLNYL